MKPKRRIYCPDCGKPKMLFETERKAQDFIRWNSDDMEAHGDELRAYYCPSCCGWHVSHKKHREDYDTRTKDLIDAYRRSKMQRKGRLDYLTTAEGEHTARVAKEIFDELPEDIRWSKTKGRVKTYVNEYIKRSGYADDGGRIRREVYLLWRNNNK